MNGEQFLRYIEDNFDVSPEYMRLAENVIRYAETLGEDEQYHFLCLTFDGTIGLSDAEIRKVCL